MRCNNCGFDNASDATHCIKCNMQLDKTAAVKQAPVAHQHEASYAGTISDSQLAKLSATGQPDTAPSSLTQCPYSDCGYPYSSELKVCPRCQRPAAPARSFTGTIDPYRIKPTVESPAPPVCYLLPVSKEGEPAEAAPKKLSFTYEQSSIQLNRDNLDPGNPSITGKVQAELTFEDGAWRLKDRSELQTTFLLASDPTPLADGDILLIGDRKFIFSSTPDQ
ncbi:MAG TPA: FHA domain-containing protein [Puia sp.]|jgi:hypothetical protein|nr:FHA domain-containing protein [Puia sp.]